METDAVMKEAGGCGRFQVVLSSLILSIKIVQAWCVIFMAFGNYNPGWTCVDDFVYANVTSENQELFTPINSSLSSINGTECDTIRSCSNLEFSKESSTIVTEWGLVCDKAWILSLITSVQMAGAVVAVLITGQVAGTMGRKFSLYFNVAIACVSNLIAAFSNSWQMFTVLRFFIGFSTGGIMVTAYPYCMEFVDSGWRTVLGAIPEWNISVVLFAACTWILKDWRHVHLATSVVSAFFFLSVFWIPDSVRWLAVRNKVSKAKRVLEKISSFNNKPPPNTEFIDQIVMQERDNRRRAAVYTYKTLLIKELRYTTFALVTMWFFIYFSYFVISFGIQALSGNFYLNLFLVNITVIPAVLPLPVIGNKIGRKWGTILFLFPASCLCFGVVVVYFVVSGTIRGTVITVLALLTSVCLDVGWILTLVSVMELFPTVVRSLGLAACAMGGRLGSVVAPYVVPKDFDTLYISYLCMGIMLLLCCGLSLTLSETKGKSLQDTIIKTTPDLETDLDRANNVSRDYETKPSDSVEFLPHNLS